MIIEFLEWLYYIKLKCFINRTNKHCRYTHLDISLEYGPFALEGLRIESILLYFHGGPIKIEHYTDKENVYGNTWLRVTRFDLNDIFKEP